MLQKTIIGKNEYYPCADVKKYFADPIYSEDVMQAIKTVRNEIAMRHKVFQKDIVKRAKKVEEMENVLRILSRCSDKYEELTKSMFGDKNGTQ